MVICPFIQYSFNELFQSSLIISFNTPSEISFSSRFLFILQYFVLERKSLKLFSIMSFFFFWGGGICNTVNKYTNFGKASGFKTFNLPIKDAHTWCTC